MEGNDDTTVICLRRQLLLVWGMTEFVSRLRCEVSCDTAQLDGPTRFVARSHSS